MISITREKIDAICAALPGTRLAGPPGELLSWKVGDKMFACFGDFEDQGGVSIKTPDTETAALLIEAGVAEKAPYFHRSWIRFTYEDADAEEVSFRLLQSYDIVRASLKKSERDAWPPRET